MKSIDELKTLHKELDGKIKTFQNEKNNTMTIIYAINKNISDIKKDIINVLQEIDNLKSIEETKKLIKKFDNEIEEFSLLNDNEINIVTNKMDKMDYRQFGSYPRWIDLERLIKKVIEIKKNYPDWTLVNLSKKYQNDTLPPQTFYQYEFKDKNNLYFTH